MLNKAKISKCHTSFWLCPETMKFIRQCSETTRISQGQVLQLIVDFYRTSRRLKKVNGDFEKLEQWERDAFDTVNYFLRVMPF